MQALLLFALVALLAAYFGRMKVQDAAKSAVSGATFRAQPLLVNQSERSAWALLQSVDLGHSHVFAKVRLEDIVKASAWDNRTYWAARGRIRSRHVDFLLTDSEFRPILAVEVDGGSHRTSRATLVDEVKNRIFASAGVPLLRLRVGDDWRAELSRWGRSRGWAP